jgi:hypothetical protein
MNFNQDFIYIIKYKLWNDSHYTNNHLIKLIIGDIVDSDPLAEYEVDPDLMYADADPETGVLPPE